MTDSFLKACEIGTQQEIYNSYGIIKNDTNIKKIMEEGFKILCKSQKISLVLWYLRLKPDPTIFTFMKNQKPYVKLTNEIKKCGFEIAMKHENIELGQYFFLSMEFFDKQLFKKIFKNACLNNLIQVLDWQYMNYDFQNELLDYETIYECCKNDVLNSIIWLYSKYNLSEIVVVCFEHACESDSINVATWTYQKYLEDTYDLSNIITKLFLAGNLTKVLEWFSTIEKISLDENTTIHIVKSLIQHSHIELLRWIALSGKIKLDDNCYALYLQYYCYNTVDIDMITQLITCVSDVSLLNLSNIYFVACCLGNYDVARFIQENFNINIRKHNDIEFEYNCINLLPENKINSNNRYVQILKFVHENVIVHFGECKNIQNIKLNRFKISCWLSSLTSDYNIIVNTNTRTCEEFSLSRLSEKALNSYANNNVCKAMGILGMEKITCHIICEDTTCLYCLELCENLVLTNCKHYMCLQKLLEWVNQKNNICKCPLCNQLVIFNECKIIN